MIPSLFSLLSSLFSSFFSMGYRISTKAASVAILLLLLLFVLYSLPEEGVGDGMAMREPTSREFETEMVEMKHGSVRVRVKGTRGQMMTVEEVATLWSTSEPFRTQWVAMIQSLVCAAR